jgi:hypothetical protein
MIIIFGDSYNKTQKIPYNKSMPINILLSSHVILAAQATNRRRGVDGREHQIRMRIPTRFSSDECFS